LPQAGLDRFDDFHREAVAVLKAAAPFVGPLIDILQRELIQEIAFVDRVDLHAIDAGLLAEASRSWQKPGSSSRFL
jgi:hypothetical protein